MTGQPGPAAPRYLSNLQVLRGVAAVMVLVYHIGNELGDRGFPGPLPDLGAGSAGVDLFFVISGFVMAHSAGAAFGRPGAPGLFLLRRIVRLVPLYWLATTIFVLAAVRNARHTGLSGDDGRWFAASYAFLFYPRGEAGDFPVHPQGWTLNYEMLFYFCFAAVLPLRRGPALAALALGFPLAAALGLAVALPWPLDRWTGSVVVEFSLGLGLAVVHARGLRIAFPLALALAVAGAAVFPLTVDAADAWLPYRGLVWGPPALAVVAAAVLYRPARGGRIRSALESLGDASYSLYLLHTTAFAALGGAISRWGPVAALPPAVYGTLCFCAALASSAAVYRWIERPTTRGLDRALGLSRRWRALVAGAPAAGQTRSRSGGVT